MPSEFYKLGWEIGRLAADRAQSKVLAAADNVDVARLAGKALENHREKVTDFHVQRPAFGLGFWDAFMSRAEELRLL